MLCLSSAYIATFEWCAANASFLAHTESNAWSGAQVGRAKKCLDFAATLYIVHLAAVSALSAFPRSFAWCALLLASRNP